MGKALTRDAILAKQDVPTERVEVPEWGGYVLVRGMSGVMRDKFEASLMSIQGNRAQRRQVEVNYSNIRAKMVAWCTVDDAGELLFTDDDVEALGVKSAAALDRVFDMAMKLSGIRDSDAEQMAEDMAQNPSGA